MRTLFSFGIAGPSTRKKELLRHIDTLQRKWFLFWQYTFWDQLQALQAMAGTTLPADVLRVK